ncbi:hypothetical protein ACFX2I_037076 [Malus domestica]|uniref:U-box domain-containing protein 35 n=1 Tax=Malus domestica TaxID=3750 RepID=UPI0004992B1B|nr:U-box domain-containing protein 35 [Malus domestica]
MSLKSKADREWGSTSTSGAGSTSTGYRDDPQPQHDEDDDDEYRNYYMKYNISSSSISEIEEEEGDDIDDEKKGKIKIPSEIKELFGFKGYPRPMPSIKEDIDDHSSHDESVYVGVGKGESSMDALTWSLKHAVDPSSSTTVYLIHVFPEVTYIPSPLGKLPKNQVTSQQVETYMAEERGKRRVLLHKFIDKCSAAKVKVDTILIESDMIGRAILDLIPILNITKLVIGTNRSNLRKVMSKKGSGIGAQILQSAPEGCEVNIICQGNPVTKTMMDQPQPPTESSFSPPPKDGTTTIISTTNRTTNSMQLQGDQHQRTEKPASSFFCFKPKS